MLLAQDADPLEVVADLIFVGSRPLAPVSPMLWKLAQICW
jgi:hypothetical protein